MTAKEYLKEIRRMKERSDSLRRRIEELWEMAASTGAIEYDKDRVQVSPVNTLEKSVLQIFHLNEKYLRSIARYHAEIQKRDAEISELNRADYEEILRLRYFEFLQFDEIADRMGKSDDRVRHLHGEALQAFEAVMQKNKVSTK